MGIMDIISGLGGNFTENMRNLGVIAPANAVPGYQTGLQKNWPLIAALGGKGLEALYGPNDFDPFLANAGKTISGVGQSALMQRSMNEARKERTGMYDMLVNYLGGEARNPASKNVESVTSKADGTVVKLIPDAALEGRGTSRGPGGVPDVSGVNILPALDQIQPLTQPPTGANQSPYSDLDAYRGIGPLLPFYLAPRE